MQLHPALVDNDSMAGDLSKHARAVTRTCDDYPDSLRALTDPPERVRIVGRWPPAQLAIAIVGTRRADDEALDFAYDLARAAALHDVAVVSGGAVGIDRAAHEGALDARGSTIIVLPSGFRAPYPSANRDLFTRVAGSGCLLTEADDQHETKRWSPLRRNRLIAALSEATVVVQAPARSGALSTAAHARALGRPLFVVPASPWDPRAKGNLKLLQKGARVCAEPADVLSTLASAAGPRGSQPPQRARKAHDLNRLTQQEQQILGALQGRARHPDEICRATGIPAPQIQRSILGFLVRGLVEERPGGRYRSCRERRRS